MSKKLFLGTIAFIFFNAVSFGQTKDEKTVADAVEQLRNAMINGDKAVLEKLTDEKLSYGHSSGHIDDKKEFVEKLASGSSDFITIDLSEQTISISENVAIVRHTLNAKTNDGGKPGEAHLKVLLIWQKGKDGWKLLARQAIKITT
jgi:ketosteroid isomerase-like protein